DELVHQDLGQAEQGGAAGAILQAAQRRGGGQRLPGGGVVLGQRLPERVVAEAIVVVEVLVAASDAEDALREQGPLGVGDEGGVPRVGQDGVEGVEQAEPTVG